MNTCPVCNTPITEHPANRCLDVLVAEYVMGFTRVYDTTFDYDHNQFGNVILLPPGETLASLSNSLPNKGKISFGYFVGKRYSSDISDAWEVVKKLTMFSIHGPIPNKPYFKVWVYITKHGHADAMGDTAPLAICRAALLTVEDKK